MTEKRRSDLIIGSLSAGIVLLGAFSLLIRGEPTEHAGPQTMAAFTIVAIISFSLYFSTRARNLRARLSENRIVTVVLFSFYLALLALATLLLVQVLGAESQPIGFYIGNGFWIFVLGLGGGSGVLSILRETDFIQQRIGTVDQ